MHLSNPSYGILLLFPFLCGSAHGDQFNGDFTGSLDGRVYQLTISGYAGGQYEGEYHAGGEILPLNARRFGDRIAGQIGVAGFRIGFVARQEDGGLLLHKENGKVILFKRNAGLSSVGNE